MPNPELEKFRQQNPQLSDKGAKEVQQVASQSQQYNVQNPDASKTASPDPARASQTARPGAPQQLDGNTANKIESTGANAPNAYNQQQSGNPELAKAQAEAAKAMQNDPGKGQIKQAEQQRDKEPER